MACRTDGNDSLNDLCALLSQARLSVQKRVDKKSVTGISHQTQGSSSLGSSEISTPELTVSGNAAVSESATCGMTWCELQETSDQGPAEEGPADYWDVRTDDGFDDGYPIRRLPVAVDPPRRALRPLPPGTVTLVVRNIPARYNKEKLLEEWVPDGSYNLLHLPFNVTSKRTCGYAFINFVSHEEASKFQETMHGTHLPEGSKKHLDVSAAEAQGFEATLALVSVSRKRQRTCFEEMLPAERLTSGEVMMLLGLQNVRLRSCQTRAQPRRATPQETPGSF